MEEKKKTVKQIRKEFLQLIEEVGKNKKLHNIDTYFKLKDLGNNATSEKIKNYTEAIKKLSVSKNNKISLVRINDFIKNNVKPNKTVLNNITNKNILNNVKTINTVSNNVNNEVINNNLNNLDHLIAQENNEHKINSVEELNKNNNQVENNLNKYVEKVE